MYRIMIIDDEQMIIKGLTKLIPWEELGYELVGTAFNGRSALETVDALSPDVIISDIQLGDTTGLELIDVIKKSNPNTLFIFISGYDNFKYCQKAISKGAIDYILKPIDFDYLKTVLLKCKTLVENRQIIDQTDRISFQSTQQTSEANDSDKIIDNIKDYIDSHFDEEIDIAMISKKFFIGQTYFSELFKKEFGINFKKYLIKIRIEKSKLYIMETDYKITKIANKVGFDDPGYFSQVFKKYTGVTPRQFKRQTRDKGE